MKKFFAVMIATMIAILTLVSVATAENTTESVQLLEANGRVTGIFLNDSDRKSASDSGKTTLLQKDMHKGTIKGAERFHGEPYAVVSWYTKTVVDAQVLYRANDTQLDSLFEGSVLCLRGLNANRSRNDDIGEAAYLFMALLDREGRTHDTVDYVFSVNKVTFSITHLRFSADDTRYYLVCGDARKGEPKTTTKKDEPKETTDWTIQPVDPISPDPDPDPEWTITGDDDTDPDPDPEWTITPDDDTDSDPDPDWTIQPGEETPGESQDEDPWTIGGGSQEETTDFTIGGGDTSDVSLLDDDWSIGGGSSSDESQSSADTDWSI